jgi:hypothetical protein
MAVVTGRSSLHQASASELADVEGATAVALVVTVVAVVAATLVIVAREAPSVAAVKAVATSQRINVATAVRRGTGPVNARRRSAMRRFTPLKPKKKRSPRCSWQARL